MKIDKKSTIKICLLSSVPVTLWSFYRGLIRQLKNCGFEVTLISSNLPELHKLKSKLNCNIFSVLISRKISFFSDIAAIVRLWKYFRENKCEIIHAHTPKGGLVGMISSWLARIPIRIYTVHGLVLETATGPKRKLIWLAEWLSCSKLATQVLAVSPSLRQRVIDEGLCPADKIRVLGCGSACGIDLAKFKLSENIREAGKKIRAKYNIPDNAIVIGFIGRVVPDKGVEGLVESFELLQRNIANTYLLIVGEFETVRETINNKTIETIKNNRHICCNDEFTDEVQSFYAAMDVLVLPSKREGFGLTLIEASAMELPVIGTKVTGCINAVEEGISGLLVEADNIQELYKAILKLVKNPDLRKKLGKLGQQRVKEKFGSQRMIELHIELYERALSDNERG